jgi:hypothetical protein
MNGQYYSIRAAEIDKTLPGQLVYKDNSSDEAAGFIYDVNTVNEEIEIVLFEPTELPNNATVLKMSEDWTKMLYKVLLEADIEIKSMWKELITIEELL